MVLYHCHIAPQKKKKKKKISSFLPRSCTVARYPVTLSKAITAVTHGYSFPLILRHNLFNWCQSWGPYGESPENTHTDRHAHLLTLKKNCTNATRSCQCGAETC